jgi:hypothetical protein
MGRSEWNAFVKKVFQEGKSKNSSYSLGDAMKEASKRKKSGKMNFHGVNKTVKQGYKSKKRRSVHKSRRHRG